MNWVKVTRVTRVTRVEWLIDCLIEWLIDWLNYNKNAKC